ncbi:MAG: sugar porter family MFS transporter [Prosthecobacter sp.]|jgi:SP family arabinose:H+ symporter-like MFS transporter|uniref:sugar porter family MFS transporter n=1 Tax=Prosthecobacter sp. TaxID=1965333 RepID=UPI0019F379CA|nr:sugar porter family MFS transporter [Prosthecobacter sp.]MBE2283249.1 sugar porter family MFS transporter [Prosthecobacter sp.]
MTPTQPTTANPRLFLWAITSALAGFLFGFDTVVISGAEKTIQSLWKLSDAMHGVAMASALYGTVLGSLIGGWPTDSWGRKKTLIWVGVLYFVSAVWSGIAPEVWSLIIARFIGGLGVGISTVAAPLYITEISPPDRRGRLAGMFQFNIVFGILVAFLSNYLLGGIGEHAWRWMLGVEAVPALFYTLMCFTLPESPRWLLTRKADREAGLAVLRQIQPQAPSAIIEANAAEILSAAKHDAASSHGFWSTKHRVPILLAFLIAFFNQLSGINAVLYFAPRIFEMTGLGAQAALLQSIGIGITNLVFTFAGLWLIDRLGRRTLLVIGSFGYIASLGLCAWAFFTEHFSIVPACIFAFIAAHAIGQGAVIWVFISEIFPDRHRATGQALGSATHWVFAALLTTFFPAMVSAFPPGWVFLFFTFMMVLQLVWVKTMVPETKGVSLEDIQKQLGIHS